MNDLRIEEFTATLARQDRAKLTIRGYRTDLESFRKWYAQSNGAPPNPADITPLDVREFRTFLRQRNLKPQTINRCLAALRSYFRWAHRRGFVAESPANGIRDIKVVDIAPRWLEHQEVKALKKAAQERVQLADLKGVTRTTAREARRDQAILVFLLNTGLRLQELCDLRMSDLTIGERGGEVVVRHGKGGNHRTIPLNLDARKALREWLGVKDSNTDEVFTSRRSGALSPRGVGKIVQRVAECAHVDDVSPHRLRHTLAKNMLDKGTPITVVAKILGHVNLNTTALYLKPAEGDLRKATEAVSWGESP